MAIPALTHGLLPPGVYTASLTEVWGVFDQPALATRPALNQALAHAVALIWARDQRALVYANGSYVTDRVDPVDVDLAVRSDTWTDSTFLSAFAAAYPGEDRLVDFFFNSMQSTQHMEDRFQAIQGSSVRKGIIRLRP